MQWQRDAVTKRVVLVTGHYWRSKRKAGFHWLADSLWRQGWEVTFMTTAISWLSVIRQDYRFTYPIRSEANRLIAVRDRLWSYVWFTPWHPANLRSALLNRLFAPLFQAYASLPLGPVTEQIQGADLILFESTPGLLLLDHCRRLNSKAKYLYRVSDDLRLLQNHPVVLAAEAHAMATVDWVSVPSQYIYDVLTQLFGPLPHLSLDLHGIRKDLFAAATRNPYRNTTGKNLIFVGNSYFDVEFIRQAAPACPDWNFHIIGAIADLPTASNITAYGEMPFEATIPYVKYADIGLQCLAYRPGAESFTDSLKIIQYTHCQLPIVAPSYLAPNREHVFFYDMTVPESIPQALTAAAAYERRQIKTAGIHSWDELVSTCVARCME